MKKILSILLIAIIIMCAFQTTSSAAIDNGEYSPDAYPYTSYPYSASRAVKYAKAFYSSNNSYFYYVNGNDCTNFVSQCVAYGLGNSTSTSYTSASSYRMFNNGNATTG